MNERLLAAPPGPIRVISMCAGQGRDLIGVLPGHQRRTDVSAMLVESDPRSVAIASESAARAGLTRFEVVEGDAGFSDVYASAVPADIVLACGIFGNVRDVEVENTVRNLSMLCREGASVLWTRHRQEPDLTPRIRSWFAESGFDEMSFDALDNETKSGVGSERLVDAPTAFRPGVRFFSFVR